MTTEEKGSHPLNSPFFIVYRASSLHNRLSGVRFRARTGSAGVISQRILSKTDKQGTSFAQPHRPSAATKILLALASATAIFLPDQLQPSSGRMSLAAA